MHGNIDEFIMICIIFLLVAYAVFKIIRVLYVNKKYSVCPKCGYKTNVVEKIEYSFGDQETYDEFYCTNFEQNCGWKYKFKF